MYRFISHAVLSSKEGKLYKSALLMTNIVIFTGFMIQFKMICFNTFTIRPRYEPAWYKKARSPLVPFEDMDCFTNSLPWIQGLRHDTEIQVKTSYNSHDFNLF